MGRYDKVVDEMMKHLEQPPSAEAINGREEIRRKLAADMLGHSAHALQLAVQMLAPLTRTGDLNAKSAEEVLVREINNLRTTAAHLRGPL